MSINHYSSLDLPETTLWWTQHQQHPQHQQQQQHHQHHQQQQHHQQHHILMEPIPSPSWPLNHHHHNHNQPTWFNSHTPQNPTIVNAPRFNLNNEEEQQHHETNNEQTTTSQEEEEQGEEEEEEKEPMFEKPLTPSDVGKLNRLVIPKQHAEKYFPLSASASSGGDTGESKGLLLSFEDESGKCWRFRYSYWNSSQSYVLTKGWSRYVKDKRLDAGDVVSFERHRGDAQRLFIRWRRRSGAAASAQVSRVGHGGGGDGDGNINGNGKSGGGVGWTSGFYCAHPSYPTHHQHLAYQQQQQHEGLHAGSQGTNQRTRPVGNCSSSSSSSKVLRLFGVNMECQPQHDSGPSTPECSYNMPSTQGADTHHFYHHHQPPSNYYSSNSHPHMVRQQPYYY